MVDLSAYAGKNVEVSISYASDDSVQLPGVFVDDIVVSTGAGSTSFEDDGDTSRRLDGARRARRQPAATTTTGSSGRWRTLPPPLGVTVQNSFARQPEILDFLCDNFGRYPFGRSRAGSSTTSTGLGFALENQTRPIYAKDFFTDPVDGDSVVVHELAHQWYGDSVSVAAWQHIWLNEGFATYAEWLWSEHEGLGTPQEIFDFYYSVIPDDDPFWELTIGDPGPDLLFDVAVYYRGAMTLQQLRVAVGDDDFFRILRKWARLNAGGNVTTDGFIQLAERISGQQLDELFDAWLFTPGKPALSETLSARRAATAQNGQAPTARNLMKRVGLRF